jgi:hypothetical protein
VKQRFSEIEVLYLTPAMRSVYIALGQGH